MDASKYLNLGGDYRCNNKMKKHLLITILEMLRTIDVSDLYTIRSQDVVNLHFCR